MEEEEAEAWKAFYETPNRFTAYAWGTRFTAASEQQEEEERRHATPLQVKEMTDKLMSKFSNEEKKSIEESKAYPVIVLRTPIEKTIVPLMTREDMECYAKFKDAILKADASFDVDKEKAWQHWTTVRDAWMKTRYGLSTFSMLGKVLGKE